MVFELLILTFKPAQDGFGGGISSGKTDQFFFEDHNSVFSQIVRPCYQKV